MLNQQLSVADSMAARGELPQPLTIRGLDGRAHDIPPFVDTLIHFSIALQRYLRLSWRAALFGCLTASLTIGPAEAQTPNDPTPASTESAASPSTAIASARGRWKWWILENRAYYDPLLAEPRAAQITALVYARSSEFPYMVESGERQMWDISLGKEIPLFGLENCNAATGRMPNKCTGFGLWLPVGFHMVEDFKDDSSPIINTDYRFGLLAKVQRGLPNGSVSVRVQVGHESTHLGDEFTIHALDAYPDTFERVNVSYEYWEYGLSYERWFSDDRHVVTFRQGGIGLIDNSKGFYGSSLLGSTEETLTPSNKNFEPSFGIEWRRPDDPIIWNWAPIVSVDARFKTVYNFHRPPNTSDERAWSVSAVFGLKHVEQSYNEKGVPILVARVYYGVNPNGQFRTQNKYFQWGFGLIVPL